MDIEEERASFYYVIENKEHTVLQTLPVDSEDVLQNADGQVDCPLDRVLRKNKLNLKDLFDMNANQATFILESPTRETILHTISFQHLVFYA